MIRWYQVLQLLQTLFKKLYSDKYGLFKPAELLRQSIMKINCFDEEFRPLARGNVVALINFNLVPL